MQLINMDARRECAVCIHSHSICLNVLKHPHTRGDFDQPSHLCEQQLVNELHSYLCMRTMWEDFSFVSTLDLQSYLIVELFTTNPLTSNHSTLDLDMLKREPFDLSIERFYHCPFDALIRQLYFRWIQVDLYGNSEDWKKSRMCNLHPFSSFSLLICSSKEFGRIHLYPSIYQL